MPLSKIQADVLRLLAAHRDPESYVAGSTPLNRDAPRYSGDIDLFHDREDRVAVAAEQDAASRPARTSLSSRALGQSCALDPDGVARLPVRRKNTAERGGE